MDRLAEITNPQKLENLISEIERDIPGLREKAASREWSPEERAADIKLNAMCETLARLREIENDIAEGHRCEDGSVHHPV